MARGPKPQGDKALTVAERQARYRARHPGAPIIRFRRPAKRRSRAQRWREAVADLVALQDDYAAWLEAMPEDHARRCHRASPASHRRSRSRRDRRHRAAARLRARRHRVMTVVTAGATPLPGPHPRGLPRWVHRHPPRIAPPDSGAVAPRCAGPPMDYLDKPTLGPTQSPRRTNTCHHFCCLMTGVQSTTLTPFLSS